MMAKKWLFFLILFSIAAAIPVLHGFSRWELSNLQTQIAKAGFWAPLIYMVVYVVATALVLPSTVLNLTGGALFGLLWGVIWTTLAAIVSAIVIFWVARKLLRGVVRRRLNSRWQDLDQEFRAGGPFYLLAVRLLPIIPYGVVNYSVGLSSLKFRDYFIGTCLGTVPGLFPFVMLGNSGVKAVATGQLLPILLPLTLIGLLVGGATWYNKRHQRLQ
jgi:uncharacterized membrane protein YdjX (TVP38/TMEM64 family)